MAIAASTNGDCSSSLKPESALAAPASSQPIVELRDALSSYWWAATANGDFKVTISGDRGRHVLQESGRVPRGKSVITSTGDYLRAECKGDGKGTWEVASPGGEVVIEFEDLSRDIPNKIAWRFQLKAGDYRRSQSPSQVVPPAYVGEASASHTFSSSNFKLEYGANAGSSNQTRSFRGTSMPLEQLAFFKEGRTYRAPMFLASSFDKTVAFDFLKETPAGSTPVVFTFVIDPVVKGDHAGLVSSLSPIPTENEMLFSPYSAFCVRKITKPPTPSWDNPVRIEVDVMPNSVSINEDVAVPKWH
jgi:hypothetical protein